MSGYHMTRKDREINDDAVVEELLAGCRLAHVSMCMGDDPYIVTMNYGYDRGGRALYFHCASKGQKLDFIEANPRVCAQIISDLGYVDGACEHKYRSLVIRGPMRRVEGLEEKKHGIDVLIEHQESDGGPVRERNLREDADYAKFEILRIDIEKVWGKESL